MIKIPVFFRKAGIFLLAEGEYRPVPDRNVMLGKL